MTILFRWALTPEQAARLEAEGWRLVARKWQASTDRWTGLMRRDG